MRRWRARSRLIAFFRLALPAAIAAIVLGLAGWLVVSGILDRLGAHPAESVGVIHMTDARFLGRDNDGRAFVITADDAIRDNFDQQKITLVHPAMTIGEATPKAIWLSADAGTYREDNRILLLNRHVRVHDNAGEEFRTSQAVVDTVKGVVAGDTPIAGHSPTGDITANSYAVYDRGEHLVFQGKVHSRLKRD
ncbi:MAG TPA: LPS export ABC transporter periplasmic protein LptC [Caulobacteraceae bacterium]|nr:LPS export ABC transporter periplasmic protein LptC [Caulobacteraceae bacterium]